MKIDDELKTNLIADVENMCDLSLSEETKESLKRCFEITIGTRLLALDLQCVGSRFDSDIFDKEWNKRKKMNWKWEYVEHGIVNRSECRRLFKKLFRQ